MGRPFDPSRRRFAAQLMGSAAFMAASLGKGKEARAALTALSNPDPRFLVNIHTRGGMDAMWWHSYCTSDDLKSFLAANPTYPSTLDQLYTERFDKNLAIPHPADSTKLMGIGMSMFSKADLAKMAIWKGMGREGDHDIGNRIINCGMFSNYASG
ncbi:MAG TPA: hypothetical protein VL588_07995, partial [Bdellovibrionota bacterium]|nr:hypothetical protein [Bdellovibrionota bacterium]